MIVTEEQAKTKWCPMARALYTDGGTFAASGNRDTNGGITSSDKCIASGCMMWRWDSFPYKPLTSETPRDGWEHISAEQAVHYDSKVELWVEPDDEYRKRHKGWCGLART